MIAKNYRYFFIEKEQAEIDALIEDKNKVIKQDRAG